MSNPHLKDQNLASCHWTTPERIVVGEADGSAPVLVTGSHACLCEELCSNSRPSRIRAEGSVRWTTLRIAAVFDHRSSG